VTAAHAPYTLGLHEVGDGAWAYTQPDGGWGWSNAGLVVDGDASLLVDTLFDLRLTAAMLDQMRAATPAAATIDVLVNTHANGDHCYGNQLVTGARIVATKACAEEMTETPASVLAGLKEAAPSLGPVGAYVADIFGPFDFDGIELAPPTDTFAGETRLTIGNRAVDVIEVGPAHTRGDAIVHVPDAAAVFTGDILFHGGHPIIWAGPISNWVAACDRIVALAPDTVVPGHGPITDVGAVRRLRDYLDALLAHARACLDAGLTALQAAREADFAVAKEWSERERLAVNLAAAYRELGADVDADILTLFGGMADLAGYA
jgi:glyoxylase-like metal-dependent hydrolase (beta-lactamase superfamily II)